MPFHLDTPVRCVGDKELRVQFTYWMSPLPATNLILTLSLQSREKIT